MKVKKFCLLIVALISFYTTGCDNTAYENKNLEANDYLNKQISNVNRDSVPDSIFEQYQFDAEILTARLIQNDPKLCNSLIRLPISVVQLFTNALIQVYNSEEIPERDVVIDEYNISVFPQPGTNYFYIKADTSKIWVKKWLSGDISTGFLEVDTLVQNYNLTIRSNIILPTATYFYFSCEESLNLLALCYSFTGIEGINEAFPESMIGDGNNISAEICDDYIFLTYTHGFGDCPSGCINRHYWNFKVYYDGSVQFVGEGGSPL